MAIARAWSSSLRTLGNLLNYAQRKPLPAPDLRALRDMSRRFVFLFSFLLPLAAIVAAKDGSLLLLVGLAGGDVYSLYKFLSFSHDLKGQPKGAVPTRRRYGLGSLSVYYGAAFILTYFQAGIGMTDVLQWLNGGGLNFSVTTVVEFIVEVVAILLVQAPLSRAMRWVRTRFVRPLPSARAC